MRAGKLIKVVACALLGGSCTSSADPTERHVEVLTADFAAESSLLPPGGWHWERRWFVFPRGCNYLKHDIEVLEEVPERAPGEHQPVHDSVRTYAPDATTDDRTADLSVMIGTFRPYSMTPGPASIKVRVAFTVECEQQALEKLKKTFGIESLH